MSQLEPLTQDPPVSSPVATPDIIVEAENRWYFVIGLILVGLILILFSKGIAIALVQRPSGGYSLDQASEIAINVRTVGGLCFLAGLFERIAISIDNLKQSR